MFALIPRPAKSPTRTEKPAKKVPRHSGRAKQAGCRAREPARANAPAEMHQQTPSKYRNRRRMGSRESSCGWSGGMITRAWELTTHCEQKFIAPHNRTAPRRWHNLDCTTCIAQNILHRTDSK
eukprot:8698594-Pyramimonas_sp.AAC.1